MSEKEQEQEQAEGQQEAKQPKQPKQPKKAGGKKAKKEQAAAEPFVRRAEASRLRKLYAKEIIAGLIKEFGYRTPMAVPRLQKITVNMGLGEALQNPKLVDAAEEELRAITGQKPVVTKARKSIATFKLRQGQSIGCMVTLRGDRMYEFFDRLVSFALPRTRDFRGISPRAFDGRGNYTLGIKEQIIFPEVHYDKIEKIMGLNVTIVTSARTDEEARSLWTRMGMPFRS
jgi:large subunit ribosomal protein L5